MASTANLRSRRSAAERHALAGVEREIRAQDSHGRRKYLREFTEAFSQYDSLLDSEQFHNALHAADVVLVGETIFARDQHILEEWWRREIDEAELRQRIRFDLDWGYDWTPFYQLLV